MTLLELLFCTALYGLIGRFWIAMFEPMFQIPYAFLPLLVVLEHLERRPTSAGKVLIRPLMVYAVIDVSVLLIPGIPGWISLWSTALPFVASVLWAARGIVRDGVIR